MSRRIQRLNGLFQEELSDLIRSELRDPRLGEIVSITRVDVAPDLENADVYISILGDPESQADTMKALEAAAPFLKRQLLLRVHIRKTPRLHFYLDRTIEDAAHVLDLMRQVSEKDSK